MDRKLKLYQDIKKCKASQNLSALLRLSPYLDNKKRKQYTLPWPNLN